MATQPGVWGIDLGQCALKALRLQEIDGQVTATAFDYVEHAKILSQPDADPDLLIREALQKFLARNTLKGDSVAISVPGQSGLARFVKLPPVEEKKIVDIVRFEAKQQIPFNLDEVVWDYQKIGSGIVTDGFAMETEIGLFAMKRDMVTRYLQHFKDVNVEIHVVQMAPLALCNYVSYDLLEGLKHKDDEEDDTGKKKCIVALDIGADSSNLIITDGDRIIWQRPIPLGGNHFTRALTKELKLTFAKGEHLKRNATKSPDLKKILAALKPVLNDFVSEVQRSLGYFTNSHRDAAVSYMVGLGNAFRLPGLQRYLSEKLQIDVRKLQKLQRLAGDSVITAPAFTDNILSFAVAYGLALQGLKSAKLQTNLLPTEIRVERAIRAKKPWAVTAAAALLLGIGGCTLGYGLEYRSYAAPDVEAAKDRAKATVKKAQDQNKRFDARKEEVDKNEKAVQTLVSGQEEKLDWLQLNRFISRALPRPNGENLLSTDGQKHSALAKKAWDKKETAIEKLDPAELGQLTEFHIESQACRYTDKLEDFWDKAKPIPVNIRPADKKDAKPVGPGWIIELIGFTDHQGKTRFVVEGLVDNLALRSVGPAPAADAPPAPPNKDDGAILNNVTHVFLQETKEDSKDMLGKSRLAEFLGETRAQSGTGTTAKGTRDGWEPLGGYEGTHQGGAANANQPAFGEMAVPAPPPGQLVRTYFRIMFVWKEPTPSDQLWSDAKPADKTVDKVVPQRPGAPQRDSPKRKTADD